MSSAQPAAAADTAPLRFAARLSPAVRPLSVVKDGFIYWIYTARFSKGLQRYEPRPHSIQVV